MSATDVGSKCKVTKFYVKSNVILRFFMKAEGKNESGIMNAAPTIRRRRCRILWI